MHYDKFVVGLTGGIGSGKTTVANLFAKYGVDIIDADIITFELTQPGKFALEEIKKKYGPTILQENGHLDRRKLRHFIFEHPTQRIWLENILHPLVREEINLQVERSHSPYCLVVIPLLIETKPNKIIDRILVVDTTEELQLQRSLLRDNLPENHIKAIIQTQANREKRINMAHDVIHNSGDPASLEPQVKKLHQRYLEIAASLKNSNQ